MGKCKNKVLLKILVSSVFLFALFFVLPMTASAAAPFTEGQAYDSSVYSDVYYADAENDEYWVVTNGAWHKCVSGIDTVVTSARQAMFDRESSFYTLFAVPKNDKTIYDYFNIINNNVYKDDGTPYGADYLKMMSTISLNEKSGRLTVSDSCADYDFYRITIDIDNKSTKTEEDIVKQFLTEWNTEFIKNNPLIQSSTGNVREYYIVKSIYNFIINNDKYDFDVYNGKISQTDNRYRISHTAYGALFGNMVIANDPNTFDYHAYSPFDKTTDSQGLYAVSAINRGLSVCDGYSLVFYYLCTLNDIDCRIVMGDNTDPAKSDPHAWNMVYLKDSIDTEYEWYAVDTTFGSQLCKKISNDISLKDYTFFLRGTDNKDYSAENHQQLYDEYKSIKQSKDDFRFEIKGVNEDSLYTMITRRRNEEIDTSNPENAAYNFEDYIIIGPQGNLLEMQQDENGDIKLVETDGFTFYSSGYYYSCEFFSLAKDIEYTCDDMFILDVGTYKFDIKTIKSDNIYHKSFTVAPLDMSNIENYEDLINYVKNVNFIGEEIEFKKYLHVYDNLDKELQEGKEYTAVCFPEGSPSTNLNPKLPGKYVIRITYQGNYCGVIDVPFTIEKADLSTLLGSSSTSEQFGMNFEDKYGGFSIGDTQVWEGKDYTVKTEGGKNYGDSGKIIFTALNSSEYLKGSTQWTYTIDNQFNVSSKFNGKYINNSHYNFTGKPIKPDNFTLYIMLNKNEKVVLVKDVDYKITGYSNNINVGTGNIKVQFIGNYTGTATLKFYIDSVKMTVTVPDLVYNGKKQSPSPVVYLGNILLKKGVDYTVTGSATNPGAYQCTVKGIGNYSKLSGTYVFHIVPSQLSGVTAKASATSVNFSWKKQGNNCIYQVWAYDTGKKRWRYISQTTGTSLKVTWIYVNGAKKNLTPNKKYTFRVRAYYQVSINGKKVEKFGKVKDISVKTTASNKAHTYKEYTTKATTSKNGSVITKCTACGEVKSKSTIYYPKTIKLSKTSYTYNGKVQTPTVTVKDSKGKTLKKNTDYTVTYAKGRKYVGKYAVKITFKGNYSGSKTLYFTIIPKATSISSVASKSKGFTVKWKKQTTQTTGYQIQYSTSSKFSSAKTVTVGSNKTTSKTISKLKAKKKYYVRVRTYKTVKVNGKNTKIYSSWSKAKAVTTK